MSNARILIVEDETIAALFLRKMLERIGHQVIDVIKSGEEAIERAAQTHPDIVLMDIRLKGKMDGVEVANIIYGLHGIPSIFMTAYSMEEVKRNYRLQGTIDPIQKPINEEELMGRIKSVLKLRNGI
jgi:CheY-like chemotaxis protein